MTLIDLIDWISNPSNLFAIILATITLIIGFFGSLYVTRKYTPKPEPVYEMSGYTIIQEKINVLPKDIKIIYGDKNVPRLSKFFLIFWNKGHVNLDGSTMQEKDPFRLEFDEGSEIFDVQLIAPIKPTIDLAYRIEKNVVYLTFNDLESNEGFNLQILHTGKNPYPQFRGSFKNIPEGMKYLSGSVYVSENKGKRRLLLSPIHFKYIYSIIGVSIGLLIVLVLFVGFLSLIFSFRFESIVFLFVIMWFGFMINEALKKIIHLKNRHPDNLTIDVR
jgi:hypothetical protein